MRAKYWFLVFLGLFVLSGWSCAPKIYQAAKPAMLTDGRYDAYPYGDVSFALNKISQSIYKFNVITFYKTYYFSKHQSFVKHNLHDSLMLSEAVAQAVTHETALGTATVVYLDNYLAGLLTCAHVVHFADTLVRYFPDAQAKVQSVSVKIKQKIFVSGMQGIEPEVVATNTKSDIALLKMDVESLPVEEMPVKLPVPVGNSAQLDWGNFVYIMGFPLGQMMLNHGIVSHPSQQRKGFFLTDAVFNKGISGAPVFAIRDGAPYFEWVGMASSGMVDKLVYLEPALDKDETYTQSEAFSGKILINRKKIIKYGLTYSVSIEEILKFVNQHQTELSENGFRVDGFFQRDVGN